jgi:hypothetical protein
MRGEARLRGRERIISSKTIRCAAPPRPLYGRSAAAPLVCASYRRAQAPGSPGRSPPARARADYFFKDHQMRCAPAPPVRAQRCCAPRMRLLPSGSSPRLSRAKPACAGESGLFLQRLSDALRPRAPCTGAALLRPSYAPLTVGLKPPALQGEARLRGRERNNCLTTIISVYTPPEAGALRDTADMNDGQRI